MLCNYKGLEPVYESAMMAMSRFAITIVIIEVENTNTA